MWVYYLGQKYANIGGKTLITPNFLQCGFHGYHKYHVSANTVSCVGKNVEKLRIQYTF